MAVRTVRRTSGRNRQRWSTRCPSSSRVRRGSGSIEQMALASCIAGLGIVCITALGDDVEVTAKYLACRIAHPVDGVRCQADSNHTSDRSNAPVPSPDDHAALDSALSATQRTDLAALDMTFGDWLAANTTGKGNDPLKAGRSLVDMDNAYQVASNDSIMADANGGTESSSSVAATNDETATEFGSSTDVLATDGNPALSPRVPDGRTVGGSRSQPKTELRPTDWKPDGLRDRIAHWFQGLFESGSSWHHYLLLSTEDGIERLDSVLNPIRENGFLGDHPNPPQIGIPVDGITTAALDFLYSPVLLGRGLSEVLMATPSTVREKGIGGATVTALSAGWQNATRDFRSWWPACTRSADDLPPGVEPLPGPFPDPVSRYRCGRGIIYGWITLPITILAPLTKTTADDFVVYPYLASRTVLEETGEGDDDPEEDSPPEATETAPDITNPRLDESTSTPSTWAP